MAVIMTFLRSAASAKASENIYYFLLNFTESSHDQIGLAQPMDSLIGGQPTVTKVSLGPRLR